MRLSILRVAVKNARRASAKSDFGDESGRGFFARLFRHSLSLLSALRCWRDGVAEVAACARAAVAHALTPRVAAATSSNAATHSPPCPLLPLAACVRVASGVVAAAAAHAHALAHAPQSDCYGRTRTATRAPSSCGRLSATRLGDARRRDHARVDEDRRVSVSRTRARTQVALARRSNDSRRATAR